jgi:threonylcarbamoyladenosine tRNA methylthiotransferase MtaB
MENPLERKVAFYTLGCKVNQYDSQAMMEQFIDKGYSIVDFAQKAHVYVINTCTVTSLADRKSRQMIRKAHERNPNAVVAVVGCYAQRAPDHVLKIPGVKLVLGTQDRKHIVELVEKTQVMENPINNVKDIMDVYEFEETPIKTYEGRTRAILKIQEGCNRFCAYCTIPYARGPVRSRLPQEVLKETKRLVNAGFKEIVLTGIHLTSYGIDLGGVDLLSILKDIHPIEGLERIRLGSLEPNYITTEFIKAVKTLPKVCPHYHISLQSGSDGVLKRMNRKYTTQQYKDIVNQLRRYIPDVAITTDIMVGFPGETEKEFQETLEFVETVEFSRLHVFKYSPRQGTPAAKFPNPISSKIKESRSQQLIALGHEMAQKYMATFINKEVEVYFEEGSKQQAQSYEGYTEHYIKVVANSPGDIKGQILRVRAETIEEGHMVGKLLKQYSHAFS